MIFCSECFYDTEIKARIIAANKNGNCSMCSGDNVNIYDAEEDMYLQGIFDKIILIYTPKDALPAEFPASKQTLIKDELMSNWRIFKGLKPEQIYRIITTLSAELYANSPELFDAPIANIQLNDPAYLKDNSILRDNTWESFVSSLKYENRFLVNI